MNPDFLAEELNRAKNRNLVFKSSTFVLEKNENSDLLSFSNPASEVFFERVFSTDGPYWSVMEETGFGVRPSKGQCGVFVAGRLFFVKNFETRFLISPGLDRELVVQNGRVVSKRVINPASLLCIASFPRDFFSQAMSQVKLAFLFSESVPDFEAEREKAFEFWKKNSVAENPLEIGQIALANAVSVMRFSFLASLAYSLRIPVVVPQNATVWVDWLEASSARTELPRKAFFEQFGFFSLNPYDLTSPRVSESRKTPKGLVFSRDPRVRFREECKLVSGLYLDVVRKAFLALGASTGLGEDVFFLRLEELDSGDVSSMQKLVQSRKGRYQSFSLFDVSSPVWFDSTWHVETKPVKPQEPSFSDHAGSSFTLTGLSAGGKKQVQGRAVWIRSSKDLKKPVKDGIVVCDALFPDLVMLYSQVKGVVSGAGGNLSHAAIVAREYDLPCVTQVKGIDGIKEGDVLLVDGQKGEVRKLGY
ncbi:MAG: hypothetical protein J4215_04225 [Candidatus Diapherotrites archaeon]|uniref:PEP-utilising enzyme mobile domain-containing protein n=1 Tax=Candidatus Iainarchaeum sp. TaxID=3101447 RepID=A0A8T4LAL7_9ARCH|nr:hypothetical protein [Candidatus Diapherotrites archaeon]